MKWTFRWHRLAGAFALAGFLGGAQAALPDPVAYGHALDLAQVDTIRGWLDEGMDPDFEADRIGTGLMHAAWNGNIPLLELFHARGANLARGNRHGEQALQLAAWNGHLDAVKWLLAKGAALERPDLHWGALHYAVFNGHEAVAAYLLEQGANVNARSPNRSTPLMMAAREGHEGALRQLLAAGADPAPKNDWGEDAMAFAMRTGQYRIAKMISSNEFADRIKRMPEPQAATAPPVLTRSVRAPSEIETILRELRLAEAEGRPTQPIRERLMAAVDRFRGPPATAEKGKPYARPVPPKSLVVTARRGQPGSEKAEVVYSTQVPVAPVRGVAPRVAPHVATVPPAPAAKPDGRAQVADLVRQIRRAEADGQPTAALRQQLFEAVDALPR